MTAHRLTNPDRRGTLEELASALVGQRALLQKLIALDTKCTALPVQLSACESRLSEIESSLRSVVVTSP